MDEIHDALFISSDGFILIKTIPKHFSTYRLARRVDHYGDSFPSAEVIAPAAQTTTYYKTIRDVRYGDVNMPVFSETGAVHDKQPKALRLLLAMTLQNELLNSELADRKKDTARLEAHNDALKENLRQFESKDLGEKNYVSKKDHVKMISDYESCLNHWISTNEELRKKVDKYKSQLAEYLKQDIEKHVKTTFIESKEKGPSAVSKAKEHTFQRGPIIYCQGDYLDD